MSEVRPDPDALLIELQARAARAARGRLRIDFGASAGVGKTYAMLGAGRALKLAGVDVAGSRHPKRWQDVEELLDAGKDAEESSLPDGGE